MRKLWKLAAVTGLAVAVGTMTSVGSAYATPPAGYGFDGHAHIIVGGGSDTTYRAQVALSDLWLESGLSGCPHNTGVSGVAPFANSCKTNANPETSNQGNYDGDTIAQANPIGSSSGIASMNGFGGAGVTYEGTVNPVPAADASACITATTGPNLDFGRSSRALKTSGGKSNCGGDETQADTQWGYAQDGVEVTVFNSRGTDFNGVTTLSPTQLYNIWMCKNGTGTGGRMRWSDVLPASVMPPGGPTDADIVPWGMNTGSGTEATFVSYINAGSGHTDFDPNANSCDRLLTGGGQPLENDIKPLVNTPAALGTTALDPDNPVNWMWWGSFGVFSAFPFTSSFTRSGTLVQAVAAPVNGILPSSQRIIQNTYPFGRTLFQMTRKADADCARTAGLCDFVGNSGPVIGAGPTTDLAVNGGTSGVSGAIREYTRFLCRGSNLQQGIDPYTGTNLGSEITTAINSAGFTIVPSAIRTTGSRCFVQ